MVFIHKNDLLRRSLRFPPNTYISPTNKCKQIYIGIFTNNHWTFAILTIVNCFRSRARKMAKKTECLDMKIKKCDKTESQVGFYSVLHYFIQMLLLTHLLPANISFFSLENVEMHKIANKIYPDLIEFLSRGICFGYEIQDKPFYLSGIFTSLSKQYMIYNQMKYVYNCNILYVSYICAWCTSEFNLSVTLRIKFSTT